MNGYGERERLGGERIVTIEVSMKEISEEGREQRRKQLRRSQPEPAI